MKRICIILCIVLFALLLAVPTLAQDQVETIRVMDRYDTILVFVGAAALALFAGAGWLIKTLSINSSSKVPPEVVKLVFDLLAAMAARTATPTDDELIARVRDEVQKLFTATGQSSGGLWMPEDDKGVG